MVNFSKMSSVCHTCGVTEDDFSRRIYFDNHVKLHDNSSPSFCDSCGKTYGNVLAFNEHVRRYHFKEFPCSQCDQKFTANIALKRHMRIHNKSSDHFPCDVLSLVLPKYIREKGMYYEFLCLEQAGERATTDSIMEKKYFK